MVFFYAAIKSRKCNSFAFRKRPFTFKRKYQDKSCTRVKIRYHKSSNSRERKKEPKLISSNGSSYTPPPELPNRYDDRKKRISIINPSCTFTQIFRLLYFYKPLYPSSYRFAFVVFFTPSTFLGTSAFRTDFVLSQPSSHTPRVLLCVLLYT